MIKTKLLKIDEIELNQELYPRLTYNDDTVYRYSKAMKKGDKFPNILVAKCNGCYVLIDGKHRIEAKKLNNETHIQSDVLSKLTKKEIYIEAIKRNITHGQPFSEEDIDEIKISLEEFKLSIEEISDIIRLPAKMIKPIVATKIDGLILNDNKISEEINDSLEQDSNDDWKEIKNIHKTSSPSNEQFIDIIYSLNRNITTFEEKINFFEGNLDSFGEEEQDKLKLNIDNLLIKLKRVKNKIGEIKRRNTENTNNTNEDESNTDFEDDGNTEEKTDINKLLEEEQEYFEDDNDN